MVILKRITLYTGVIGYNLFKDEINFCASVERFSESDLKLTVNEEDVEFYCMDEEKNVVLYDVVGFDSIEWIKG